MNKNSIIYKAHQPIGPNNIIYLNDVRTKRNKYGKSERKAKFLCYCGNTFITDLKKVKSGHTSSCGCLPKKPSIKYERGDIIIPNGPVYVTESKEKYIAPGGQVFRRAVFLCTCGRTFIARIDSVKSGLSTNCGCSKKAGRGWNKDDYIKSSKNYDNSDPKVYVIEVFDSIETFIKIGITYKSVEERFKYSLPYTYKIIKEIKGSAGFVWDEEVRLHRLFKDYKYIPEKEFKGMTECFNLRILKYIQL